MKKLLLLFLVALFTGNVNAQWLSNGPYGGFMTCFAISGNNIFAGAGSGYQGGVFLSTNNGATWTQVNNGLTYPDVSSLAVSGSNIFAGTSGGVFLSTDNGADWTQVYGVADEGYADITALAVSGTNIFASVYNEGVFLSTDNGNSWASVNTDLPVSVTFQVNSFAVMGSSIFIGSESNGIFLSANNGVSWTEANTGIAGTPIITSFAVSGGNIYAGTSGGLYLSTDTGSSWTLIQANYRVLSIAVNGPNIFAGLNGLGVYFSSDMGATWALVDSGLTNLVVNVLAVKDSGILAGTGGGGVFLSNNNGSTWRPVNTDLSAVYVNSLTIDGSNIFAATNGGIFLSADDGGSWTLVNNGLTNDGVVIPVNSIVSNGSNIFAGTNQGVYLSTNNGFSWATVDSGLDILPNYEPISVYKLAIRGSTLVAATSNGIFVSANNGALWSMENTGLPSPFASPVDAVTFSGSNIFVGTGQNGVYISSNNGSNWTAVNTGLPITNDTYTNTDFGAFLVTDSGIFASTGTSLYFSTNNGANWTLADSGTSAFVLAESGADLFAGGSGVFLSADNGAHWGEVSEGLAYSSIESMAVNDSNIFVGTTGGVWQHTLNNFNVPLTLSISTVNATCWGLSNGKATVTAFGGSPPYSYSWEIPLPAFIDSVVNLPAGTYSVQVYDSSNDSATISFTIYQPAPLVANVAYNYGGTCKDTATVSVTGGTPPYETLWDGKFDGSSIVNVCFGETDTVLVTDSNGCTADTILSDRIRLINASVNTTSNLTCNGNCSGKAIAVVSGIYPPFSYLWNTSPIQTTDTAFNLCAGTYTVSIYDSLNDSISDTIEIITITESSIAIDSIVTIGPTCPSSCNGIITIYISGGDAPYTFRLDSMDNSDAIWQAYSVDPYYSYGNICSGQPGILVTDSNGCNAQTKFTVTSDFTTCDVWPGDANDDGVANNKDILAIGLAYNDTGQVRPNASLVWIGQPAPDWDTSVPGGLNAKYADCNGDGIVNADDTLAVTVNYAFTHSKANNRGDSSAPSLSIHLPPNDSVKAGQIIQVPVYLGTANNPENAIYGTAFSINYNSALVDSNVQLSASGSWLGTPGVNLLTFQENFYNSGTIDLALTRTDHADVSGYGLLCTVSYIMKDDISGKGEISQILPFSISGVTAITSKGLPVPLNYGETDTVIAYQYTGISNISQSNSLRVYPNPAGQYIIADAGKTTVDQYIIIDLLGTQLDIINVKQQGPMNINVSQLSAGMYFLQARSGDEVTTLKFSVIR